MNSKYIFPVLLILAAIIIFGLAKQPTDLNIQKQEKEQEIQGTSLLTKSLDMGAVSVDITPKAVDTNSEIVMQMSLNTHSVELDYDLTSIVSLTDDKGRSYRTISWNGGAGGHHLSGELRFDSLATDAKSLNLTITGIDNQTATTTWEL